MLKVDPVIYKRPKEPINAKGMLIITISENRGDSNCIAITRKIRNTATKIAMAMIIIGGLVASTVLILLLMPTFYLIIDKRSRKAKRLVKKEERKNRKEERKAEKRAKKGEKDRENK
mgnify:CR=1 FL=1